jgi:methylated-DNA-[protein]-cysteine S-methyltransferase
MAIEFARTASPVGPLLVAADEAGLRLIEFTSRPGATVPPREWRRATKPRGALRAALAQLDEYFAGRRRAFDLPLAPEGTPFQLACWRAVARIPYGATITYAELARRAGRPAAPRAAGAANGRNPLPIVVPCHRVVGSDGALRGFGGGLPAKARLLALERAR